MELVPNSSRDEAEGTKTMDSTEIALNKRNDDDISFKKRVSRNMYAAINHFEK